MKYNLNKLDIFKATHEHDTNYKENATFKEVTNHIVNNHSYKIDFQIDCMFIDIFDYMGNEIYPMFAIINPENGIGTYMDIHFKKIKRLKVINELLNG